MEILYIVAAIVVVGAIVVFIVRFVRFDRSVSINLTEVCREWGIPDVPFDSQAAVRQVLAGTRPSIPRDGSWWLIYGIGQVGYPSRTRLVFEGPADTLDTVHDEITELFNAFGGTSPLAPHQGESRVVGPMPGFPSDVVSARITGRWRPFEGWLVAVPPTLFGTRR